MTWYLVLLVFVSAIALDFADTSNTRAVAEGRSHTAALWSVTMYALGCVGFFSILKVSLWMAVPEGLGLYVGSLLAMRWHTRKKQLLSGPPGSKVQK